MIEIMKEKYKSEFKTHKLNSGKSTNKKSIKKVSKLEESQGQQQRKQEMNNQIQYLERLPLKLLIPVGC